jgi:hypothetical protein
LLDFWHGSQHLWELGRACHGGDDLNRNHVVEKVPPIGD